MKDSEKTALAVYIGWTFLHLIFLVIGWGDGDVSDFWPFSRNPTIEYDYDFSEFLVYVGGPAVIYIIYRLIPDQYKQK